jgi:hypothetical protein
MNPDFFKVLIITLNIYIQYSLIQEVIKYTFMRHFHFLSFILLLSFSCQKSAEAPPQTFDMKGEGIESNSFKSKDEIHANTNSGSVTTTTGSSNLMFASASMSGQSSPVFPVVASQDKTIVVENNKKKIIRNADIRFQVEDYKKSTAAIVKSVKDSGGYISNSREDNNNYGLSTTMTIRVNSPQFDGLIDGLLKEAKFVNYKNITAEDITALFVDTEARLKTKKEVEKRYIDILKQAKTIEEILRVEDQLGSIREEIEAKEGQLKLMNDQVSYSTISLQFYESVEAVTQPEDGFFARIKKGIKTGWEMLVGFIVGVFYVWPLLFLAGLGVFLFRRWRKDKKNL